MCIFCKIINKELPSDIIYENEDVICIHDIQPVAPVHVLIIPKKHYEDVLEMTTSENGAHLADAVLKAAAEVAKKMNTQNAFRLINNCGVDAGQTVMHVHFHLLGGKKMREKIL